MKTEEKKTSTRQHEWGEGGKEGKKEGRKEGMNGDHEMLVAGRWTCVSCIMRVADAQMLYAACGHHLCYDCFATVAETNPQSGKRKNSTSPVRMCCPRCKSLLRFLVPATTEACSGAMTDVEIAESYKAFPYLAEYNMAHWSAASSVHDYFHEVCAAFRHASVFAWSLMGALICMAYLCWADDLIPDDTPYIGYVDDVVVALVMLFLVFRAAREYQRSMAVPVNLAGKGGVITHAAQIHEA